MGGMKSLLATGFVLLVLLPLFRWRYTVGYEPLAIASFLAAISSLLIIRDDATGPRLASVFGLAGFFFFVALFLTAPIPRPYVGVGVTQYQKTDYLDHEYEEPHEHDDSPVAHDDSMGADDLMSSEMEYGGHVGDEYPDAAVTEPDDMEHAVVELDGLEPVKTDLEIMEEAAAMMDEALQPESNDEPYDYFEGIRPAEAELENELDSKY
jgi:hypothetical protein